MNNDSTIMNSNHTTPTPDNKKSKKKLIILIVAIILLVVVAVASYLFIANNNKLWPFATNNSAVNEQSSEQSSLKIEKVTLSGDKGQEVVSIDLKLNSEDKGYCVLTMSSKIAGLTIDDSKAKEEPKATVPLKDCLGWSVGTSGLPNGTYKLDVKFVGSKSKLTASSEVTLKNGTSPSETPDTDSHN